MKLSVSELLFTTPINHAESLSLLYYKQGFCNKP